MEESIAILEGGLAKFPDYAPYKIFLALSHYSNQSYKASTECLLEVAQSHAPLDGYDKAIEHYRRALTLDYGNISWRLALAKLLAQEGSVANAIHEAKICLRLKPQYQPAITLIEKLSILPETAEN